LASKYNDIWLINIYAPSGTAKRSEREAFFNSDLPYLLPTTQCEVILAGDFNCLLSDEDCTGQKNYSTALASIVRGFHLTDVWNATPLRHIYTHYTTTGASRTDRIYVTENLKQRKRSVEIVAAAFTDHMAVIMGLSTDVPPVRRGKGYWRMNISLLAESTFQDRLRTQWVKW
jgi:endonuclease/exonuclease/phosphatase family metal-dependent hydrolase